MPLKNGSYKGANWATRRALLEMLKMGGELSSAEMSGELGVSAMAVRQHMQELEAVGDVVSESRSQGKGRPSKYWRLTVQAERHFPDRHRDLFLDLLNNVRSTLGEAALERLLDERGEQQIRQYQTRFERSEGFEKKVQALAEIRKEEGYMAEARRVAEDEFELVENHCPICAAADACRGICAKEKEVFARTLGPDCKVERVEHLLSGGRRCRYRIQRGATD